MLLTMRESAMTDEQASAPKWTVEDVLRIIGDLGAFRRNVEQFDRSCDAFQAQYPQLVEKYPDRWVAFYNGVLVATNEDFESLLQRLKGLGIPPGHTCVKFVFKEPVDMFL
jgi:hypothetical protein